MINFPRGSQGISEANVRDSQAIKKQLLKHAEKRLHSKMGEKYQRVVLKCLRNGFGVGDDSKEDLKCQEITPPGSHTGLSHTHRPAALILY
ncbi:hypothetical protein F4776DRAFT_609331 [Hypoxylon sp. NC0597]|nr:hypothetical protein F4776DRAFT_609331 [Hypoxylon sp. NC0597]